MYLVAILGLCALTSPSLAGVAVPAQPLQLAQENSPQQDAPPAGSPPAPSHNAEPASPAPEASQPSAEPQSEPAPPPKAIPAPDAAQPQPVQPETTAKKPESKKSTKKHRRRKHAAAGTSPTPPEKKVVRNGGTADPVVQLAPGMSADQASSQRQNTTQLLTTTDANLKQITSRQLSPSQQDSVSQIRKYIQQAKAAEEAGDVQRAHNLASKALLLSDDLVKH